MMGPHCVYVPIAARIHHENNSHYPEGLTWNSPTSGDKPYLSMNIKKNPEERIPNFTALGVSV